MARFRNKILLTLLCLTAAGGLTGAAGQTSNSEAVQMPFRGAWIATVANIDWPSRDAVGNPALQQEEMIGLLDSLQALGMNAIVFQIRPTADALYYSELEPWSHWLTGTQGYWQRDALAWEVEDFYDPLEFVTAEAHDRGIAVHAWLNPYRVTIKSMDTTKLVSNHIMRRHPEWFWQYGEQWYFEPGLDETREWICMVVEDIVCRYDIDAIHMDDYFYPYPVARQALPDHECFEAHPRGFTDIRDWRRNNVNMAIRDISHTIHKTKPWVQFGISPFGVWRNNSRDSLGSATTAGLTNYDHLYADVLYWIREGWIDYVCPQLYWHIGNRAADYKTLAYWWALRVAEANNYHQSSINSIVNQSSNRQSSNCQLYIGMAPYRLGSEKENSAWRTGNEIDRQMQLNRTIPEISGECFYSTKPLLRNPLGVCDTIKGYYLQDRPTD